MDVYKDWQQPVRWAWSLIYGLASTAYIQKPIISTLLLPESQTTDATLKDRALYDQVWNSKLPTVELAQSLLFKPIPLSLSIEDRTRLTYERAKLICDAYNLSIEDVLYLTPNFWKLHTDLIGSMDGGAITLITIQYNLFVGTVAQYADDRSDLELVLDRAMKFKISGQFLLTEVGHGLDARNLETTATLLPNGDFDLHSPSLAAAKCMPPTTPRSGLPTMGVVMAKLIVKGEDYGVRPFLVPLTDGQEMCQGVTSKALPPRTGAHPIDHALTYFNHVCLPCSALLGPIEKPKNERSQFFSSIQRVSAGTLFLSAGCVPLLKNAIYNASLFSMRRKVKGHDGRIIAVMSFRTQHLPILHAIAQYHVLQAFFIKAATEFRNVKYDPRVRHGFATVFKAVALQHFQRSIKAMNDGCGWHGYFEHNQLLQSELEFRAVGTAEGDIRVLAIRLASELLLGRYQLPTPQNPSSLVAQHESGLFTEARAYLQSIGGFHRSEKFNRKILPLSLPLVQAIGHRMALEAAQTAGIDSKLLALYESGVIKEDSAWYSEQGGLSRNAQIEMEAKAADALLPDMERLVQETGAQAYSNAPMASEAEWDEFVAGLETFSGDASFDFGLCDSEKNVVEASHL